MIQTIGTESLPFDDFTVAKEAIKNMDEVKTTNWKIYGQKKN